MNLTGISRNGACGSSPLSTASTWGIPLPEAWGEYRRTSQAAMAVAVAHMAMMRSKPANRRPCAHAIKTSRT